MGSVQNGFTVNAFCPKRRKRITLFESLTTNGSARLVLFNSKKGSDGDRC